MISLLSHMVETYNGIYKAIDRNGLTDVPDDIPNSTCELRLELNFIIRLRRNIFTHLKNLCMLTLDENHISYIETRAFNGLSQLYWLSLKYNRLRFLEPGMFDGLDSGVPGLIVHLRGNLISKLQKGVFSKLSSCIELDLRANKITFIEDGAFLGLNRLRRLFLNDNKIFVFESLCRLNSLEYSLEYLDLCISNLTTLSPTVKGNVPKCHNLLPHSPVQDVTLPDVSVKNYGMC